MGLRWFLVGVLVCGGVGEIGWFVWDVVVVYGEVDVDVIGVF